MLLDQLRESGPRQVLVRTRQAAVGDLLRAILRGWHYRTEPAATGRRVALVEPGLAIPAGVCHAIRLSPEPLGEEPHLSVPLSLSALHQALGPWFFQTPRRYLRLALELPVRLEGGGAWLEGRLLSLSERGGRVACQSSLPLGTAWQLTFLLAGRPLRFAAEVIYLIPPGDVPGWELCQYGLLFKPFPAASSRALRRFIERTLLERACARAGIAPHDPVCGWFDTVSDPWGELAH